MYQHQISDNDNYDDNDGARSFFGLIIDVMEIAIFCYFLAWCKCKCS